MSQPFRQSSKRKRLWVLIPLLWLLLANQWAAAFAGNMQMPTNTSNNTSPHAGMMMAMAGMTHMPKKQDACQHHLQANCHVNQQQNSPTPSNEHCNGTSSCSLCHAAPALIAAASLLAVLPANLDNHWYSPLYISIISPALDRPPASSLA